jgi:hypothetical protein
MSQEKFHISKINIKKTSKYVTKALECLCLRLRVEQLDRLMLSNIEERIFQKEQFEKKC